MSYRVVRGDLIIGTGGGAKLPNNVAGGFLWLPVVNGHPGTPTSLTDIAPVCIDGTDRTLIWYDNLGAGPGWRSFVQQPFRMSINPSIQTVTPAKVTGDATYYWLKDFDPGNYNVVRVRSNAAGDPDWYLTSIVPPSNPDGHMLLLINDNGSSTAGAAMHVMHDGGDSGHNTDPVTPAAAKSATDARKIKDPLNPFEQYSPRNSFVLLIYSSTYARWIVGGDNA